MYDLVLEAEKLLTEISQTGYIRKDEVKSWFALLNKRRKEYDDDMDALSKELEKSNEK